MQFIVRIDAAANEDYVDVYFPFMPAFTVLSAKLIFD
jgi:hypothetical protein